MKIKKYNHALAATYNQMIARCYNLKSANYKNYGAKGISVCDRWHGEYGFTNFILDMGDRPLKYQLDRIDSSKGYSPENCRWVSTTAQSCNRRKFKQNKSGYKGVSWSKQRKKWRAACAYKKKDYVIGYFESKEDAAKAYDAKIRELHGEFALTNFPVTSSPES